MARIEASKPRLVAQARTQFGIEMRQGPFGIDSRASLVGAKVAEAQSHTVGEAYHAALMRAYWQDAADISDREVLADLAGEAGLERAAFLASLNDPAYDAAVAADIALAGQLGLTGVPAMVFNMKYLVSGAQPYPELLNVVRQCEAETGRP